MKKSKKTPPAAPPPISRGRIREVVETLLLDGDDAAEAGASPAEIDAARKEIAARADFNARYELGATIKKLDIIFDRATKEGNLRAALEATKQKSDALKLYEYAVAETEAGAAFDERETVVRKYLESVGVCRRGLKLEELARQVAAYIADRILPEELRKDKDETNDDEE